jgi:hypothetical protein
MRVRKGRPRELAVRPHLVGGVVHHGVGEDEDVGVGEQRARQVHGHPCASVATQSSALQPGAPTSSRIDPSLVPTVSRFRLRTPA